MGSRLSAIELTKKYDTGFHHLPQKKDSYSRDLVVVDLEGLMARPDRAEVIPTIPAQQLYLAFKTEGIEENHEALAYLNAEQLTRIMDYDCWPDHKLNRKSVFNWLKYFNGFGPGALYQAYRRLDEEYQISLMQGLVRVYDEEEVEKLPHDIRDRLFPFPGHQLFYDIMTEDGSEIEFVNNLVNSCFAGEMEYAFALLQHATFDVPNEPELQLAQFRKARLEEDGFVTTEEAQSCFMPFNLEAFKKRWEQLGSMYQFDEESTSLLQTQYANEMPFMDRVRNAAVEKWNLDVALNVHQRSVIAANHICTACDVEPNQVTEIKEVFDQSHALISLGLEFASRQSVTAGVGILAEEQPTVLFRTGVTLVHLVRNKLIEVMKAKHMPFAEKLEKMNSKARYGQLQWLLDTECFTYFGFELTERLKGIFNRFPMSAERDDTTGRIIFTPIQSLASLNDTAEQLAAEISKFNLHN